MWRISQFIAGHKEYICTTFKKTSSFPLRRSRPENLTLTHKNRPAVDRPWRAQPMHCNSCSIYSIIIASWLTSQNSWDEHAVVVVRTDVEHEFTKWNFCCSGAIETSKPDWKKNYLTRKMNKEKGKNRIMHGRLNKRSAHIRTSACMRMYTYIWAQQA